MHISPVGDKLILEVQCDGENGVGVGYKAQDITVPSNKFRSVLPGTLKNVNKS